MPTLEIACFDAASALIASNAGTDRIELCQDREAGGTTPSLDTVKFVKESVTIPVFVMIRPRGGDFCYSSAEFEQMASDIDELMPLVDGFVFGILDEERRVDVTRTVLLAVRAHPLPCTFHRAIDETPDKLNALEDVIKTGCSTVLTSGGAASAIDGPDVLAELVQVAGNRIEVMPGGGVRSDNIALLRDITQVSAFHSSALLGENEVPRVDEIRHMKQLLSDRTSRSSHHDSQYNQEQ